ncbi:adiponectin receptor protein, partial [Pseudohyphozyma bogoriensis]
MEIAQLRSVVNALALRLGVDPTNPMSSYRPTLLQQAQAMAPLQYFQQQPVHTMLPSPIDQRAAPLSQFSGTLTYHVAPPSVESSKSMTSSPTMSVLSFSEAQQQQRQQPDIVVGKPRPTISTSPTLLNPVNVNTAADLGYAETPTASLPGLSLATLKTSFRIFQPIHPRGPPITMSTVRRRAASRSISSSSIPSPKRRPRSHSFHPSNEDKLPYAPFQFQYGSSLLESLDLSGSILLLRQYLLGKVEEAEEGVRALKALVEESEMEETTELSDESDEEEWEVVTHRRHGRGSARPSRAPTSDEDDEEDEARLGESTTLSEEISTLEQFVRTASSFLDAIREELPSLAVSPIATSASLVQFQLSPDARLALDHFLEDHPMPSLPQFSIRERLGESRRNATHNAAALLSRVSSELSGLQTVLSQLTTNVSIAVPKDVDLTSYLPSLPSLPPLPSPPLPPLNNLREYFSAESEKLNQTLRSFRPSASSITASASTIGANLYQLGSETAGTLQQSMSTLKGEATELTHLLSSHSSAALDEAARMYHAAVERGRKGLLMYDELPPQWQNNEHILGGYRFIGIDSWGRLLASAFTLHNETVNIQSHFIGFLSLLGLLIFVLPNSPHALPDSHWGDTAVAVLFLVAGMKCLACSTAWHLMAGCSNVHWNTAAACVDYVGISGLIAASVMGMEYYGFYCSPNLAAFYMTFSAVLGIAGMILPWKPWFNERKFKMWRVGFFLGLAASALMPVAHATILHGVRNTFNFM